MEQHSQSRSSLNPRTVLEGQIRECYGRVVYSHKTHEQCSEILASRLIQIKICQITLSALTAGGFISHFLGAGDIGSGVGIVVSTILLILNTYTMNYDLGELSQKHKYAANKIWFIRERYLSLLTDLVGGEKSLEKLQQERDTLIKDLNSIYIGSPNTNIKAYKKAQFRLKEQEDMTFIDQEIDAFLPSELKRNP